MLTGGAPGAQAAAFGFNLLLAVDELLTLGVPSGDELDIIWLEIDVKVVWGFVVSVVSKNRK